MKHALILIDLQNDYLPGGAFPLWNTGSVLAAAEAAIGRARAAGIPIVHVQHVADASAGVAPFFNAKTPGVEIAERIRAAAPEAPVIVKAHADAFHQTNLGETLGSLGVTSLLLAGMMTQNCVTHTALSKVAAAYDITILTDACTTVSEILHLIALHALSTRVRLAATSAAL